MGSSRREGTRNKDGVRDRLEATTRDTTHARVYTFTEALRVRMSRNEEKSERVRER